MTLKQTIADLVARHGVSSPFGPRVLAGRRQFHNGIDIPCPEGTRITIPLMEGQTARIWWDDTWGGGLSCVVLGDTERYGFAHLKAANITNTGLVLETGNTGTSTGPHLHFTVFRGQEGWVDPLAWLKR